MARRNCIESSFKISKITLWRNLMRPESESERHSLLSDSLWPHGLYSPWNSPGQNTGVGLAVPYSGGSSQPRNQTQVSRIAGRFLTLQAESLPGEPQGKSKNTGVGSLSLLQGIFPTQESNRVFCITGAFFTCRAT